MDPWKEIYIYMNIFPACTYVNNVCFMPTEARRHCWIPLELELQMILRHHVSAGNQKYMKKMLSTSLVIKDMQISIVVRLQKCDHGTYNPQETKEERVQGQCGLHSAADEAHCVGLVHVVL